MNRPTDKLLKEMSNDELRAESEWHVKRSESLREKVNTMRAQALDASPEESMEILRRASGVETEAENHRHQSLVLLMACQPNAVPTPIKRAGA